MHIITKKRLVCFWTDNAAAKRSLQTWFADASAASWRTPADVKRYEGSASFPGNDRVVFNIKGNEYRLVVKIDYRTGKIFIRFVGTHAAYDAMNRTKGAANV